jgi:chromosome segregation ATPase
MDEKGQTVIIAHEGEVLVAKSMELKLGNLEEAQFIYSLEGDCTAYVNERMSIQASLWQAYKERNRMSEKINEATAHFNGVTNDLKHQEALVMAVRRDRDVLVRKCAKIGKDTNDVSNELQILSSLVDLMKREVHGDDQRLMNQHRRLCQLNEGNSKFEREVDDYENKFNQFQHEIERTFARVEYAYHMKTESDRALKRITNDNEYLAFLIAHLNRLVTQKGDHCGLLHEEVRVFGDLFRMGSDKFSRTMSEIRTYETELMMAVNHQKALIFQRRRMNSLQNEYNRLQLLMLRTSARATALTEEAERPMNIHRWRILMSSDPPHFALIQFRNSILDEVYSRIRILDRMDLELAEIREQNEKQRIAASKQFPRVAEEHAALEELLRQRKRELKELKEKVLPCDSLLTEKRKVQSVRRVVRLQNLETTESQQMVSELRLSVHSPRSGSPSKRAPGRFNMGGGFAVGEAKVIQEFPLIDARRVQNDRGAQPKGVMIAVPRSARPNRPTTVRLAPRKKIRALLSARAPEVMI